MILYKYMSFDATKKAIETPSVGFSCLEDLNDPFECTAFGFKDDENTIVNARIATNACKNRFSRKYGVLSLTRQPLNALMWSHYGDSHQGIVIGIDVDMAGLSDMASCIIPSQYGEVIYTATKPHKDMPIISSEELMDIGDSIKFDPNTYNLVTSRVRRYRLIPLTEPYIRVTYTAPASPSPGQTGTVIPTSTPAISTSFSCW